jgi:acetylglutamate synthase
MPTPTRKPITREEFDKRLDESNEQHRTGLQQKEEEQARAEQLLLRYENTLDEVEAELRLKDDPLSHAALLRKRLEELARKTTDLATTL